VDIGSFLRAAIPILKERFDPVDPYLDLEPVSHPDIVRIIQLFESEGIFPFNNFIPTTGVALAQRSDYHEVLDACKEAGIKGFEFTIHGNERFHNEAVNNERALRLQLESLDRVKQHGFLAQSNVIVSKKLIEHFQEVCLFLAENAFDTFRLTVPSFAPIERLRQFQAHRADLHDVVEVIDHELFQICTNSSFWTRYRNYMEKALLEEIASFGSTWEEIIDQFPQWVFITIAPGLDVYYGNGNIFHSKIGNIRETDFDEIIEAIMELESNYCINGYYNVHLLPPVKEIIQSYGQRYSEMIYPSLDDIIMLCIDRYQMHWRGIES